MSVELKLQLKDMSWLGQAFENKSFISPLGDGRLAEFTNKDTQKLINQRIIKEDNTINAEYYTPLEILAYADGFIDTTFRRGPIKAKKQIICQGDKKVSVVYQGDGATITMPSNPKAMAKFIGEYMGKSILTGSDLGIELPANEAFCLAVITDHYRKAVFSAYAKEEVFVYTGVSKDELLRASNTVRENSQSLAFHVFVINAGFPEFTLAIIEESLNNLSGKGLVKKENDVYRPVGEALLFAGNFLIIENIIEVIVGQVHNNNLYRSNFMLLQAGPLDVLYLEKSKENILLECLSALKAVELMTAVLDSKPNIV
ncbi:MAG: hypothetical protein ACOYVD_11510 [Bacillota bacterium]